MLYYIITLHLLWAVYATVRSTRINADNTVNGFSTAIQAFALNFVIAPISMVIGTYTEYKNEPSILEIFTK